MRDLEPVKSFSDEQMGVLGFAVGRALDFGNFLEGLPNTDAVTPEIDRVAQQILLGLSLFNRTRSLTDEYMSGETSYERLGYETESIQGAAASALDFRTLAAAVASDLPSVRLKWRTYPSVVELRAEYVAHLEALRSEDATLRERTTALLHALRLQLCFAANTFC
jgi:hypothetical protein